jgi:hypothetical protein
MIRIRFDGRKKNNMMKRQEESQALCSPSFRRVNSAEAHTHDIDKGYRRVSTLQTHTHTHEISTKPVTS